MGAVPAIQLGHTGRKGSQLPPHKGVNADGTKKQLPPDQLRKTLLDEVNYDGYFLEYDTDRAGGFEPLRFLPKGNKQVVLGLITSKSGTLEKKDDVKRRIEQATKFVPLDQLALSPQCGFASGIAGNRLDEDEQWRKLDLMNDVARRVWG